MRRAVLHLVTPLVWRIPGHGARKLHGFAKAEQGSRMPGTRVPGVPPAEPVAAHPGRGSAPRPARRVTVSIRRSAQCRPANTRTGERQPEADSAANRR